MSSSGRYTVVSIAVLLSTLLIAAADAQMSPVGAPSSSMSMSPGSATGPSIAAAPGPSIATEDCLTVLTDSSDCLSFVEAGSTLTVPEKPCCGELKKVIDNRPDCLCQMLAKNNSIGIEFDVKQAMKLPSVCKLQTPPVSLCSLFGITVDGPAGAPGVSPDSSTPGMSPGATPGNSATTNAHLSGVATVVGAAITLLSFMLAF